MTDTDIAALVERLRACPGIGDPECNCEEAADALEACQAELREAAYQRTKLQIRHDRQVARAEKAEAELTSGADTWLLEAITIWKHRAEAAEAGWKTCAEGVDTARAEKAEAEIEREKRERKLQAEVTGRAIARAEKAEAEIELLKAELRDL